MCLGELRSSNPMASQAGPVQKPPGRRVGLGGIPEEAARRRMIELPRVPPLVEDVAADASVERDQLVVHREARAHLRGADALLHVSDPRPVPSPYPSAPA